MDAVSYRFVKLFSIDLFGSKAKERISLAEWCCYNKIEEHAADEDIKYSEDYY